MVSLIYLSNSLFRQRVMPVVLRSVGAHKMRIVAMIAAFLLAGLLPSPAVTLLAHKVLPAAIADTTAAWLIAILPQPTSAAAAGLTPAPTKWVVLGNRLWLEDDFDGDATTGTAKSVGAGYVVRALASDGVTVYTGMTDAKGFYTVSVPANDTYMVTAAQPTGMVDTPVRAHSGQAPATNDNRNHNRLGTTVVITETDNLSIDFGFYHLTKQVALGDRLWLEDDNDGNAATGTVTPVGAGHVVTAVASDGKSTYTGVTDTNGYYLVLVPENDTYTVTTARPAGVVDTPVFTSNGNTPLLHNDKNHDRTGVTVVMTETDNLSIDFGFFINTVLPTVNLGNYVWFDSDGDGLQNEPPSAGRDGITVTLTYPNGATATTVTSNGGYYTFTHLLPNQQYLVQFAVPVGYSLTTKDQGSDALDSDPGNDGRITVNLGSTDDYTIDAGLVNTVVPSAVTVGDRAWYDNNHDGQQGSAVSEPGVAGVLVTLYSALTEQPVLVNGASLTELTDSNGNYLFTNLPPGAYFVVFSNLPAGYTTTLPNSGDDAADSDADATGRTAATAFLNGGEEDLTLDIGIRQPLASLGDWVWEDLNHNGVQDQDEPGLVGVMVTLHGAVGTTTTTTDALGYYTFTHLLPGVPYTVTFTPPSEYTTTVANSGGNDGLDSDGLVVNVPPLAPGTHNPTFDSGFVRLAPDLTLTKQVMSGAELIQPGTIVTYALTYGNQGNGVAVGVVITETVSAHTTFVAQKSTPGWSCSDGAAAGSHCLFTVDDVLPGASGTVIFAVKIDAIVPAGTAISNLAMIGADSNQVEGVSANNEDEVTITVVGPTTLLEGEEPGLANFRLYLPMISK